MMMTMMVTD